MIEYLGLFWSLVGFAAFFKTLLPPDIYEFLTDLKADIVKRWSIYHTVTIADGSGVGTNDLYTYASFYSTCLENKADALTADCPQNADKLSFFIADNQRVIDEFRGARIKWNFEKTMVDGLYGKEEIRSIHLTLARNSRHLVRDYLQFVMAAGREIEKTTGEKKLHTNIFQQWDSVPFNPPATLDTIALDPDRRAMLKEDLTRFMDGKQHYSTVGRAWKRGYLLYGPPGTGKSSLIGAIANFTGYDVYDLELTQVRNNIELRQLLLRVKNRSIVVVEDIDCSIFIENRGESDQTASETDSRKRKDPESNGETSETEKARKRRKMRRRRRRSRAVNQPTNPDDVGVTLSGLLNFTDGLWSSCGSERIFVFTTNFASSLDEALLRPGRMDVHLKLGYCSFAMFRSLAETYLGVEEHELFPEIEGLLAKAKMSPADVVEMLLRHGSNATAALENVVKTLGETSDDERDEWSDGSL